MARPTKYTDSKGDLICEMVAEGNSASKACNAVGIRLKTLYAWLRQNEEFCNNYARAREDAADTLVDELMAIAEDEEDVQRAKLKIDARKWVAARMKPKSWGDKQQHEHSGPNGGPIESRQTIDPGKLSKTTLEDLMAARASTEADG